MVLISALMLFGIAVDLIVYPNFARQFAVYRIFTTILMLGGWVLVGRIKKPWQLSVATHLLALLPILTIEKMIYDAQDPASYYYGGINVVLVCLALLLRWKLIESVLLAGVCVLSFLCVMYATGLTYRGGILPSYFVFVTALISVGATHFGYERRFREFQLVRKLQDANQQLRAMDETKTRFFSNISHELRTPLTLILGPLENLRVHRKYRKDTLLNEHLDMIEDSSMRLLRLINDILDLVKLDSDEAPPRPELIDVEEFINMKTRNLRSISSLKDITFSSRCEVVDQKSVWLDRDRLEKIVLNLAVNAVKFTPPGGVITLEAETKNGNLILTVSDTGEGMGEEALANIFVRFWQADMSAKRKHRGAGLGLALVKSLTDSMQGEISVQSELGKGTTFTVVIPAPQPEGRKVEVVRKDDHDVFERFNEKAKTSDVLRVSGELVDSCEREEGEVTAPPAPGGRKRILVAEDEGTMRAFIVRQLDEYEVVEARDGKEALSLALREKPDLMILDYMMPELDGIDLTKQLRASATTARVPIVLITAQAGEGARLEALEAGVNDFLTKPFSSVELMARVRNLLSSSEFETQLAENHVYLQAAYGQLKQQGAILAQAEKLSSLGRMSAGIVHEINNPLNYARTALYALKSFDRQLPEEDREDFVEVLGDAREGVDRVVEIVKGLRSFTRGDEVPMSEIVLADVVESSHKLCQASMSDIAFTSRVPAEFVINGNEVQLCQLFVNMFQNATRAIMVSDSRDRLGEIEVSAETVENQQVVVKVRDNGCGISKEDMERIFDPFFTKNDVGEGMGLGLSITYRIIEQHRARIEVDSKVGEFTEFSLYFPLKSSLKGD
jgi:signal transduction histidine kinase